MIRYLNEYYTWIVAAGVGSNDRVASSPDSYVSYLNTVSKLLEKEVSPEILSNDSDVENIARQLEGRRAPKTITNYKSAMKQYVAMVQSKRLS